MIPRSRERTPTLGGLVLRAHSPPKRSPLTGRRFAGTDRSSAQRPGGGAGHSKNLEGGSPSSRDHPDLSRFDDRYYNAGVCAGDLSRRQSLPRCARSSASTPIIPARFNSGSCSGFRASSTIGHAVRAYLGGAGHAARISAHQPGHRYVNSSRTRKTHLSDHLARPITARGMRAWHRHRDIVP